MLLSISPQTLAAETTSKSDQLDVQLDCDWSSKQTRYWKVRLTLIDPETGDSGIDEATNRSDSDRTTGAFSLSEDRRSLIFQPRHSMRGGAVRVRLRGSRQAKIAIELLGDERNKSSAGVPTTAREIPLVDCLDGRTIHSIDAETDSSPANSSGPTWTLKRVVGDELRLQRLRDVPVYEPGEPLSLTVSAHAMVSQLSRDLTMQYSIVRVSHDETVALHRQPILIDSRGNSEPIAIDETAPERPGVYEIRCQVSQGDDKIWTRLRRREPPVVRIGRPFIVLSEDGLSPTIPVDSWKNAGVIRPSESSWSMGKWLPKPTSRFIPGSSSQNKLPHKELARAKYAGESISIIRPTESFQATLPVTTPGYPHKITIRYPATQKTDLRIVVGGIDHQATPAVSLQINHTPVWERKDGWRTYTFVHYPVDDDQIWLTNLDSSSDARFESITVAAGPTHLADPIEWIANDPDDAVEDPERQVTRHAVLQPKDIDWVSSFASDVAKRASLSQCDSTTIAMYELWIAVDRLRDHAVVNGMNAIMLPASSRGRSWFESRQFFARQEAEVSMQHRLAMTLRLLEKSELDIYVNVEPDFLLSAPEQAIREQPSRIHELTRIQQGKRDQYHILRPIVQDSLSSLVAEIHAQCSQYDCFAGIALECGPRSHLQPPLQILDDSRSLDLFAQSMGVSVDPDQLRAWASGDGKSSVMEWLQGEIGRIYQVIGRSAPGEPIIMTMRRLTSSKQRNESTELAIDPFKTRGLGSPNSIRHQVIPGEALQYVPSQRLTRAALLHQQLGMNPSLPPTAAVFLRAAESLDRTSPRVDEFVLTDTCRVIDQTDPAMVVVQMPLVGRFLNPQLTRVLRSYTSLPPSGMRQVPPIDAASQTVHMRAGTHNGYFYVSMVGVAPWDSEVDIETSNPVAWEWVNGLSDDSGITALTRTRSRIRVPEGQLVVLRSVDPAPKTFVKTWTTRVSGGPKALENIKRKVTLIVERIGLLAEFDSYDVLTNGGFEQSSTMGLVGWLHAQHPKDCVQVDDTEFSEGKHSVVLTTDPRATARTWIVSETIAPPESGRLAVSLACRAELKPDASPHRLKVSIEATRHGNPIRFSTEVDIPRNGQWGNREIVLEADGIEATNVDSLRLTIDSLSGGRVWIDDVRLHDRFPTAKERAEVQTQAFLAVQGLQRGNLTPSGRLLQNRWAHHLLTLRSAQNSKRVIETVKPAQDPPGVAERIRSWIPRPLRF